MTRWTSAPWPAQRASVPPQPTSGSSGWAKTARARAGVVASITGREPIVTPMSDEPDLQELRTLAEVVALEAAALLADGLDRVRTDVGTKTTGTDMVTEMDRASEALIEARLLGARPEDGILGEEGADSTGTSGVRWIVDPLDGTTNYLYGFPGFNVSIAAEVDGEAVVGAGVDVVRGELFSAARGLGATRDGRPIQASGAARLGHALV